jgi:hypothetical protein
MTRFTDELLSAYLDGEVTTEERAAVEAQLAASEADRRLLEELQALRGEFQSLPKATVTEGFADRVVRAAVAAKEREAQVTPASAAPAKRSLHWAYWAAAAALGLAVCAVVIGQNWRPNNNNVVEGPGAPQEPTLAERLIAELHLAAPGAGEAAVVRLRVPKNAPLGQLLETAFAEAGITSRPSFDTQSGAIQFGAAYRQQLQDKTPDELISVSSALFINASLEQVESALAALAADGQRQLELAAEAKLALADLPKPSEAVGEDGSEQTNQPFTQVLNAGMFKLAKRAAAAVNPAAAPATLDRKQSVRILILVEQVE